MKLFQAAVALVAGIVASGADAAVPKNKRELKKTLDYRAKNGLFDKNTLMNGAQPYSEAAKKNVGFRKLGYDITGSFSVQFQSCFSLTTSYEDIFDDDEEYGGYKMAMMENGNLIALQSYAIFRLCYNNVCEANGNEAMLDYVVDLGTYVQALVNYLPEQMEQFCEGCLENQEACMMILYGGYASAYENGREYNYRQNYNAYDNNYNGANVNNVNYQYGAYGYRGSSYNYNNAGQQDNGGYQGGYENGNDDGNYNNGQQQQQQAYSSGYDNNGNNANDANNNADADYNGNRKLVELHEFEKRVLKNGQTVKQLDCNLCLHYGCVWDDDDGNDLYGFEAASEWLQETAECRETNIQYSGYGNNYYQNQDNDGNELFVGFLCNADGNGVELGLFLDEECILYVASEPYSNYMSYFDQTYVEMTKEIIEFTFSNAVLSCKDQEIVYTTQDLGDYNTYNYYQDWDGQDDEVAEWCEMLVDGGESTPVDVSSCGMFNGDYYAQQYNNGGQNQYEEYYKQYQNQDQSMQYQYMYSWYRYEILEDDSMDMYAVCKLIKDYQGELHTFYNQNNGNMYDYSNANSASETITEFMESSGNDLNFVESASLLRTMNAAEKFGIVAGTGIMVGAAVALYIRFRTSVEDDSKEEALIDDEETVEQKGEVS